ncbi:MAG: alpha/beta-type small acid-soluble spore protein [Peptococcaceae bacterium]|nr:MAG: alpha/beta-type small acid-soluble spore protein [Peptococcaceae bacterium]
MGRKKDNSRLRSKRDLHRLKWETARELGLEEDLASPGDKLTVREAGKIGGGMVKKLVEAGGKNLAEKQE